MKTVLILLFIISSIWANNFELVEYESMGRPFIKNYSYMDYKGHNQVWGGVQDREGVLYFVNSNVGVLQYDGVNWRHIKLANNSSGRTIDIDKDGVIYVGGVGDFGYLKSENGETKFISLIHLIPEKYKKFEYVWECVAVSDGIYFGTDNIIYRYHDGKIDVIESENGFHITRKVRDKAYTRVFDKGLMIIDKNQLILLPDGEKFADISMNALIPYDDKSILVASREKGLFLYDGKSFKEFKTKADEFLLKNKIYDGKALSNNEIIIATKNGAVVLYKDGEVKQFLNKDIGIRDNFITNIFVDNQKNLWLSLENGISKVETPSPFSLYGAYSGIKSSINYISRYMGSLYISTMHGIYKEKQLPKSESEIFEKIEGIDVNAWKMLPLQSSLLVGTNSGIYEIKNSTPTLLKVVDDSVLDMVSFEDSIFVSTSKGLDVIEYKNDKWRKKVEIEGIDVQPWSLAVDSNETIWGSSETGVVFSVDKDFKVKKYNSMDGFNFYISYIDNRVYLSTSKGIYYFDKKLKKFIEDEKLKGFSDVSKLIGDFDGNIWIRHSNPQKLTFAKKVKDGYEFVELPFKRVNGYRFEDIYPDTSNITYFAGAEGLVKYNSNIDTKVAPYFSLIKEVKFDNHIVYGGEVNRDILQDEKPTFFYAKNNLKFKFSAPYFINEDKIYYQVFLKGYDEEYSDWFKSPFVDYTNLKEGDYTFLVRARNIYGVTSSEDSFDFSILPPWYRTWWAYLIYALLGLIVIYLIVLHQVRKAQKKAQEALEKEQEYSRELEEKVAERTKELKENYIKLDEKSQKVNNLLNNAGQGFLSFSRDLRIDNEYSKECLNIFEDEIENQKFSLLVFSDDLAKKEFFEKTIKEILLEDDKLKVELVLGLLPREFKIDGKFIFANYKIIDNQKMMVILTDVTEKKHLEEKMAEEQNRLKMVVKAVTDRNDLSELISEYKKFCSNDLEAILDSNASLKEKISEIYRPIHTFKGLFAQMDMYYIVQKLHSLESDISKFRDNLTDESEEEFRVIFPKDLCDWLEEDLRVLKSTLGDGFFKDDKVITISSDKLFEIEELMDTLLSDEEKEWLLPHIKSLRYKPFKEYLKAYPSLIEKLSDRLEKPTHPLEIKGGDILVDPSFYSGFTKSLIHLFRNAIDHGIEQMDERIENGKDEIASIECEISKDGDKINLLILDDGRGIDTGKIKAKAKEKGIEVEGLSEEEVLNLIFEDNFSTKDEVSELSGRGVGLSAIKHELEKIAGSFRVESEVGSGTAFYFTLPIR